MAFVNRKLHELSNIEGLLHHWKHRCLFRCHSQVDDVVTYYDNLDDLKCEDKCNVDFNGLLASMQHNELQEAQE